MPISPADQQFQFLQHQDALESILTSLGHPRLQKKFEKFNPSPTI